jgi:long-chain-fatty-acid--[acyl-carrier-protein] ligase
MLARLFLRYVGRALVWLRYRVQIDGLEQLRAVKGPLLVLPNHPGFIDPVLVMTQLGGEINLQPLVASFMYRPPLLNPLMRFVGAYEVPDLVTHSQSARDQVKPLIDRVVAGLDAGGRFLIYPAGKIERNGMEQIGFTRAVPDILSQRPDTTVVLVRTVGVWGSMTTFAPMGKEPNIGKNFISTLGILASNLIFFAPRRRIHMTVEIHRAKDLPGINREVFNPWIEAWYNRGLSTKATFVPYHFLFGPRTYEFPEIQLGWDVPLDKITPETWAALHEVLEEK